MNENEIGRIAAAINQLRPDWPIASLRSLLNRSELIHRTRRDVAVALTWVACEVDSKTPARVIEAGPWWRATGAEDGNTAPRPPKPHEACRDCGRHVDRCDCDHGPVTRPTPTPDPTSHVAALRGLVAPAPKEIRP